jgi:hypothetical protein
LALLAVPALVATGCSAASSDDAVAGPGMSDLAPSYDARPAQSRDEAEEKPAGKRDDRGARARGSGQDAARTPQPGESPKTRGSRNGDGGSTDAAPAEPPLAAPRPVTVRDPSGDVGGGVEQAPASADIVAVRLSRRGDVVEVRTSFAAPVPSRQSGSKGMNVASFYDVDDNGIVDYEVWASLADDGWGTGHLDRRQEKATFGPSTGIRVSVEGDTLVTRFSVERIGGADVFRWSAASEWGSYESMASSTSARDHAPDDGAVDYPG